MAANLLSALESCVQLGDAGSEQKWGDLRGTAAKLPQRGDGKEAFHGGHSREEVDGRWAGRVGQSQEEGIG